VFSNSGSPRTITVQDTVNPELTILDASASNGNCATGANNTVTCTVSARSNAPATITIRVQVSANGRPGDRISNQAIASDDLSRTALSDRVFVDIIAAPPTAQTVPPGSTNTPTVPPGSTNTPTSGQPGATNTPTSGQPPAATNTPKPKSSGGGGGGGGGAEPTAPLPALPPTPGEAQQLPPLPGPGQPNLPPPPLPPVPRVGGVGIQRTPVRVAPAATFTATPIPVTPSLAPLEPGLFFRMQSDWGSAFPKQEVNYVIAAQHTRDMRNLQIVSTLPANLVVVGASASYGRDPNLKHVDPIVAGNQVSLKLDSLRAGEQVFVTIKTRVQDGVDAGTRIISQAQLTYTGISSAAFSNIVTVLVVGAAPTQVTAVQQATIAATAAAQAATASATASATMTAVATATETPQPSPADTPAPSPTATAGTQPPSSAPLPDTSTGVPISGFALLGLTLMLRTVRVHRAQSRI
jgi:hypothetical protein